MPRPMLEVDRLSENQIPPYEDWPRSPRLSILQTSRFLHNEVSKELYGQRTVSLSVDACRLDAEVQCPDLLFRSLRWPGYQLLPWGRLKAIKILISGPIDSADYHEFCACVISALHQMEDLVSALSATRKLPTMMIEFPFSHTCDWLPGEGKSRRSLTMPIFNACSRQYLRSIDLILSPLRRLRNVHQVHLMLPKGFERFDCEFDIPKPLESLMTTPHGIESLREVEAMETVLDALDMLSDLCLDELSGPKAGQLRILRLMRWDEYFKKTKQQFKRCRSLLPDLKLAAWEMLQMREQIHKQLAYKTSSEETLKNIHECFPNGLSRLSKERYRLQGWRGSVTQQCLLFASYDKVVFPRNSRQHVRGRAQISDSADTVDSPWDTAESKREWKKLPNRHLHRSWTPCGCYRKPPGTGRKRVRASWSTDRWVDTECSRKDRAALLLS